MIITPLTLEVSEPNLGHCPPVSAAAKRPSVLWLPYDDNDYSFAVVQKRSTPVGMFGRPQIDAGIPAFHHELGSKQVAKPCLCLKQLHVIAWAFVSLRLRVFQYSPYS